jgi:murein DD-endopeptidase MepM/ murein hydrolase activator NlpD
LTKNFKYNYYNIVYKKRLTVLIITILLSATLISLITPHANAQFRQIWETIVGNPSSNTGPVYDDEGNETVGTGPDDLGPGEFLIPFKCSLKYYSDTYYNHSAYSIDLNRGLPGDDQGDPVFASADGVVVDIQDGNGQVAIKHEGGYITVYAHMWPYYVKEGNRVRAGQKIGEVNDRGADPGAHHIHYNQCKECSSVGQCVWEPTRSYRGCRIQVKFKGYKEDPNSVFPSYETDKKFYYTKCY